jgi:hypothetical protein
MIDVLDGAYAAMRAKAMTVAEVASICLSFRLRPLEVPHAAVA